MAGGGQKVGELRYLPSGAQVVSFSDGRANSLSGTSWIQKGLLFTVAKCFLVSLGGGELQPSLSSEAT